MFYILSSFFSWYSLVCLSVLPFFAFANTDHHALRGIIIADVVPTATSVSNFPTNTEYKNNIKSTSQGDPQ